MTDNWYEAAVSAEPPHHIMSVVDWASDAYAPVPKQPSLPKYNVFPWGTNDPTAGNRSVVQYVPDTLASPAGWHALQSASDPLYTLRARADEWRNTTTTAGNNVLAQENWAGGSAFLDNHRPDGGAALVFDFPYEPRAAPATDARAAAKEYIDAAVTQLFVTSNLVHDLFYRYGFDERAGNFQQHNFGRGGRGGDAVVAHAQDGAGLNNADFMTPPDGQSGRCRMYLFNTADPYRDGDLEAGVLIHELAHGLSNRLTGGPADASCLGWGESGGMGEGWGDFIATTVRATKGDHDYTLGEWVSNRPGGIRNYPFSTNETVNPTTYKTLDRPAYW
jgi:extracellular elastinolytic metalloproteinase